MQKIMTVNIKEFTPDLTVIVNDLNDKSTLQKEDIPYNIDMLTNVVNDCTSFQEDCSGGKDSVVSDPKTNADPSHLEPTYHAIDINDINQSEVEGTFSINEEHSQVLVKGCKDDGQTLAEPALEDASPTEREGVTGVSEAPMKCPWYDVHLAMQRHQLDEEKNIEMIMRKYSYNDLRNKLLLLQEQLTVHHDLLDEFEKSKAREAELERKVRDLQAERAEDKKKIKKYFSRFNKAKQELADRENEVVQLKLNLANSKDLQGHQDSEVRRLTVSKKELEKENGNLRHLNLLLSSKCQDNKVIPDSVAIAPQKRWPNLFNHHSRDESKILQPPTGIMHRVASASSYFRPSQTNELNACTSPTRTQQQVESFPMAPLKNEGNGGNKHNASWEMQDMACVKRESVIQESRAFLSKAKSNKSNGLSTCSRLEKVWSTREK